MAYNEHMERIEGERSERDVIYESLANVTEYEMLQIHPDGVKILVYLDTGDYEDKVVRYGDADVTVRSSKQVPAVLYECESLQELLEYYESESYESDSDEGENENENENANDQSHYRIDSDEYREWANSLVTTEDLRHAALNRGMAPDRDPAHETMTCVACGGQQKITLECWCLYQGQQLGDTGEWQPQPPDPDCNTCNGSGSAETECGRCDSIGVIAKYPFIELFDEETGDTKRITLDLVELLNRGDIGLTEYVSDYKAPDSGTEIGYHRIEFDLRTYISGEIAKFGFDPDTVGIVTGDGVQAIPGTETINVDGGYGMWHKINGERKKRSFDDYESLSADEILEKAQQSLAKQFANQVDRLKNASGLVAGEEWILRKLPPFEQSFELFKQRLFQTAYKDGHYTLGYTQFNPSGESSVPAIFILDQDGNKVFRLSGSENIHASLESARVMFEALRLTEGVLQPEDN